MRGGTWPCPIALALQNEKQSAFGSCSPDDLLHVSEPHHSRCCRLRDTLLTPCRPNRLLEVLMRPKLSSSRGRVLEGMLLCGCPSCLPAVTALSRVHRCTACSACTAGQRCVGSSSMSNGRGEVA